MSQILALVLALLDDIGGDGRGAGRSTGTDRSLGGHLRRRRLLSPPPTAATSEASVNTPLTTGNRIATPPRAACHGRYRRRPVLSRR